MTEEERDEDSRRPMRMDFAIDVVSTDDATRTLTVKLTPDPRRYVRTESEGGPGYLDKYLRYLIPEREIIDSAARQLAGIPVYHLASSIKSVSEYVAARDSAVSAELQGGDYVPPAEKAIPHQDARHDQRPRDLVFLSVDICGSTALRRLDAGKFDQAYRIFLRELGTVVGQFNGTIYKPTGDGFIAYIDHPSFTSRSDQAIDLGLSILAILADSLRPSFKKVGLPELHVRIGADCGNAAFRKIEVPATGFTETEIASDALNRAVKIQEVAELDQFWIGRDLYELIHVQWLERAANVPLPGDVFGEPGYRLYRVT